MEVFSSKGEITLEMVIRGTNLSLVHVPSELIEEIKFEPAVCSCERGSLRPHRLQKCISPQARSGSLQRGQGQPTSGSGSGVTGPERADDFSGVPGGKETRRCALTFWVSPLLTETSPWRRGISAGSGPDGCRREISFAIISCIAEGAILHAGVIGKLLPVEGIASSMFALIQDSLLYALLDALLLAVQRLDSVGKMPSGRARRCLP
jgi:hypothetical protein